MNEWMVQREAGAEWADISKPEEPVGSGHCLMHWKKIWDIRTTHFKTFKSRQEIPRGSLKNVATHSQCHATGRKILQKVDDEWLTAGVPTRKPEETGRSYASRGRCWQHERNGRRKREGRQFSTAGKINHNNDAAWNLWEQCKDDQGNYLRQIFHTAARNQGTVKKKKKKKKIREGKKKQTVTKRVKRERRRGAGVFYWGQVK